MAAHLVYSLFMVVGITPAPYTRIKTMKTNTLYIARELFEAAIKTSGLPSREQSGYIRIDGAKGRRVYVAATKKVGRVDISGFEVEFGAKVPHMGVAGNVKQQLDLSPELTEAGILENFAALLATLKTLPPVEKAPKPEAAPKAATAKTEGTTPPKPVAAPETPEAKAKRMALIATVAAAKGVKVSKKATAK